jgi:hypothetical protein
MATALTSCRSIQQPFLEENYREHSMWCCRLSENWTSHSSGYPVTMKSSTEEKALPTAIVKGHSRRTIESAKAQNQSYLTP